MTSLFQPEHPLSRALSRALSTTLPTKLATKFRLGASVRLGNGILLALLLPAIATVATEEIEHARLYTAPDPAAPGGIEGRLEYAPARVRQVLAVPPLKPEHVYRATLSGSDRTAFRFTGLPMDRYDLIVILEDRVFEGTRLHRGESTLNSTDREQIADIVTRSEPFFDIKVIHRLEGETGRGGTARAFCTFARSTLSEMYMGPVIRDGLRRTHKLVMLRQVGPGWQIERTRDLYPIWIETHETRLLRPAHHHRPDLSGIRVTDHVRDLGTVDLELRRR